SQASFEKEERKDLEDELIRILSLTLGRWEDAEALLTRRIEQDANDTEALLWLSSLKLRRGDVAGYLALREQQAKQVPPPLGALILCHLAEASDEHSVGADRVLGYYRAARALDHANPCAMEAMKAMGRRTKSWRSAAALLPEADEKQLDW